MLTIINVFAFPPKESRISSVNLWLRYGTNDSRAVKAEITSPSAERLLFIARASTKITHLAVVWKSVQHVVTVEAFFVIDSARFKNALRTR